MAHLIIRDYSTVDFLQTTHSRRPIPRLLRWGMGFLLWVQERIYIPLLLIIYSVICQVNTLRPRQNGRLFADDTFKPIFLNDSIRISIKISLKFVPKVPINNIPALVQIMAWRRPGEKPLSEPMMVNFPTHICVTRPQWVKAILGLHLLLCHRYGSREAGFAPTVFGW